MQLLKVNFSFESLWIKHTVKCRLVKAKDRLEFNTLMVEFNDKIFNALIYRIEVLGLTHFTFALRNGKR